MASDKHDPTAWSEGAPELIRPDKDMTFVSLHHHSTFSFLDGYGMPEAHARRAVELGMTHLALTEHGNVSSHVRLEQACDQWGIKPLFGCELYTGGVEEDDRTQRKNHLTVLAENEEGYRNLLRVVTRGWDEGFYYEPTVGGAMLRDHAEGLIVLSGCSGSLLATSLVGGKNVAQEDASYRRAKKVAERFRRSFGDSYYLEVQAFPELDKTRDINVGLARMGEELGIPLVATLDAHYTRPEESELQQILHNIRPGEKRTMEDMARAWSYDVKLTDPPSDAHLFKALKATGLTPRQAREAIFNSREIAERCDVRLPKIDSLRYPLTEGVDDPVFLFRDWIRRGWKYRRVWERGDVKEYRARLKYEMELIEEKGFVDYFLVVSDAVRFAKNSGIPVGPARGSAAASLVCYLLRITEVDPMHFPNLLFERFIDRNRHDLPDIDLDFDDERRHEVREYLATKYGEDRVGNIGTWTNFKGKNSIDDIARVYRLPNWDVERLKNLLVERSSGDLRANATIEDTVEMFDEARQIVEQHPDLLKSTLLEGNVKGMSVHAAGLVIANDPLTNACAVYTRREKDGSVTQVVSLDKYDAEYLNVLKLDALGLKTMAAIRIALEHIGMTLEELYALPFEDEETIAGFREGDVVGVFQFDGRAMRSVNTGVRPDNFMEICDINALARPGPLHSGATAEYIDCKHGRKDATHYHPIVDRVTQHTQFQVVYQEQILQIVRELGHFSWEEAARIRKIISKKRGEQEFNSMRKKFIRGSKRHDMDPDDADKVFSMLATAGAYAFNAAHCVSYGMLAYWTMWLKRHHPQAFYVGALRKVGTDKKAKVRMASLLRDAAKHELPIKKLHMNKSEAQWTTDGTGIRPGFVQIKGVGESTATKLLEKREELGGFSDWSDVLSVNGVGPATLELMKGFIHDTDPFDLDLLRDTLQKVRDQILSGDLDMLPDPTHTSADVPYDRADTNTEVVWLGVIRERNLKDLFELHHSRTGEHLDPATVKDAHLNEWVVLLGEDDTDLLVITVDRWRYRRFKDAVWGIDLGKDLVLVRGLKKGFQSRRAIYVTDIWVIDPEEEEQ